MNGKSVCGRFLSRASLMTEDKNFFFAKFFVAGSFLQKTASTAIDVDVARALERLRRAQRRLDFFSNTSQNKRRTSCNGSSRSYEMLPNSKKTAIPAHPPTYPPPRSLGPYPFPCPSFSCKFFANSNRALFPPVHLLWGIHREWLCRCICCCCCMGVWRMHQVLLLPMLFLRCCCNNSNNIIIMLRVCTSLFCPIFAKSGGGIKVFAIAPNFCKKNDKNGRISFSEVYSPFYRSSANQNEDTFSCEKYG